jgi:hypothetical protein
MSTRRGAAYGTLVGIVLALLLVALPLLLSDTREEARDSVFFLAIPLIALGLTVGALTGSLLGRRTPTTTSGPALYLLLLLSTLTFLAWALFGI